MRVPTLHRKPVWQRFFAGVVIGGCISWMVFLFMYGTLQEKQTKEIEKQNSIIKDLRQEKSIWQDEWNKLTKKNADMLIIQNVNVKIKGYEKYNIKDSHSIFEKEEEIKEDLRSLVAKDINTVYQNKELIFKTIENKTIKINNRRYKFVIKDIFFFSTININLELRLAD
ncbi:sporulation membrane protein YtrI [Bacillus sp. FJAT-49736]|uniref:sporulation membrane protein YtrI n=1 Tax=Bacillus sp. FJAT-49736 TaxID=2833582 RepID=UPI001BCA3E13|nr:sporulation membrane protein YtrI [Bacillus sp. FJAT-49736]MBS4173802.1 sporulation protein [Bacillus sp. FJAT-49736]